MNAISWLTLLKLNMVILMQLQHVRFSLPKIFINIWKSTLKTYHGYKVSLIYIFSHHCDLGKEFHDNKHVYSKKRTLNNWLNFPKMHPRIHQYNTLMGTEYINAPHVTFSLPEISPQIWKLFLKTFSECKVSLIYFVIIAILGNAFITAITT